MRKVCLVFIAGAMFAFAQGDALRISNVEISGAQRFSEPALAAASGLKPGGPATKAGLDGACEKLMRSGLFESCAYEYIPVSQTSATVKMKVKEAPAEQTAKLNIPNVEEDRLWAWLKTNEPLVQAKMPANDDAIQFYTAAIQRFLREQKLPSDVQPSIESNLATHETTLIFRPSKTADVVDVKFSGNSTITAPALEKVLQPIAKGMGYTEYDFRKLLDENIRVLYLERGHLRVTFPVVIARDAPGGVSVLTTISEGPVYTLGKVDVEGGSETSNAAVRFERGTPANWRKVERNVEQLLQNLRNEGHLQASSRIDTQFNESTRIANLTVHLTRGKQFTFGKLEIEGLTPDLEKRVRALWALPAGAPLNEGYTNEFVKIAFEKGGMGPEFNGVAHQLNIRPDSTIVDVQIRFKRG